MESWGANLYGDPCRECAFDWSIGAADAVAWVAGLEPRLADATATARGPERRPTGGWTVSGYVSHVGDNLRQWAERVQCARLSGQLEVSGYDPDVLAEARAYTEISLEAAVWSAGLAATAWASVLGDAVREGVELTHVTRGLQRAQDVARNNCHDVFHHLWDIEQILGGA
jgi:hypothetical protein